MRFRIVRAWPEPDLPAVDEMAPGRRFPPPNRGDRKRARRLARRFAAGLAVESTSCYHYRQPERAIWELPVKVN